MTCGIYQIETRPGCNYIGSSKRINARLKEHLGSLKRGKHCNPKLQASFNKYGGRSRILLVCREENQYFYEQLCLDELKPTLNLNQRADKPPRGTARYWLGKVGPWAGKSRPEMRGNTFAKNPSPETRAKLRARKPNRPWLGKHHSEETKQKIRAAGLGNTRRLGKPHPCSDERRRKMIAANKGKPWSAARRAAHSSEVLSNAQRKAWADGKYNQRSGR